jgi:four helix bundle protein
MAIYTNLPVYKSALDLFAKVFQACKNMERDVKFTVGERLHKEIIELELNVYRANCTEDADKKAACIGNARENLETVRLLLRLLHELKHLKEEAFVDLNVDIESISKQLVGWQKSTKGIEEN